MYHKTNPNPVRYSSIFRVQVQYIIKLFRAQLGSPRFFKSKSNNFLKLNYKISHDFDKKFVLAFYNSFLKIILNCDNEDMLILDTCSFQQKMLSNLPCVLIFSLTKFVLEDGFKDSCVLKNF